MLPGDLATPAQAPLDEHAEVVRHVDGCEFLKRGADLQLELGRVRRCRECIDSVSSWTSSSSG